MWCKRSNTPTQTKQRWTGKMPAHFSLWLKEGHGGFKSATKTEDAEVDPVWDPFHEVRRQVSGRGAPSERELDWSVGGGIPGCE